MAKDKYTYYIGSQRVYPANDVNFAYELEPEEKYMRLKMTSSLDFSDRVVDGVEIADYTLLKEYESDRYIELTVKKLQTNNNYSTFLTVWLDLTGEWNTSKKKVNCAVITNDSYSFVDKFGDKKFNILKLGLTAVDVIQRVDAVDNTISNCLYLNDVIETIFTNIYEVAGCSMTSQFLTSATNPYTTETSETTKLYICNKQSVVDTTSEPEVLELSFEDLMRYLRIEFNLYWYISGDVLYIEHLYFFILNFSYSSAKSVAVDLTSYTNNGKSFSDDLIFNKNSYKYDQKSLVNEERFKYIEYENIAFKDSTIRYDIKLLEETVINYNVDISADIQYILNNSDISNNGVCLMACEIDGADLIIIRRDVIVSVNEFETFRNTNLDTFEFEGNNITHAEGNINENFHTNSIVVSQNDEVVISFYFTKVSGTMPQLQFAGSTATISEGNNEISFTKLTSGSFSYFASIVNLGDCRYSLTNFRMTRQTIKNVVNATLAWSDLLFKYHRIGRLLSEGYMNGLYVEFERPKKIKIQSLSTIPITSFTPYGLVKTYIGNGEVQRATFNENDQYDLEVYHD